MNERALHPATARFIEAGRRAGLTLDVRHLPEDTRTAESAARAIGTTVPRIGKTIALASDAGITLVLIAGDRRIDFGKAEALLGRPQTMAPPAVVRERTGSPIGGLAPLGHDPPLPLIVDASVIAAPSVWVSAGIPGVVCEVPAAGLLELPQAVRGDVAE